MSALSPTATSLRIFLVENHEDTLAYLTMYLEMLGHTVVSARGLGEAISTLPAANCQVVISDIGLPDGSGWDLLQRLNLSEPIYAIAMSGFGTKVDQDRSKSAGFRQHLLKPFDPERLDSILEDAASEVAKKRN